MALRVVLADDHPIVLEGLRVLLERAGIEVAAVASDGREAARLAITAEPDVVVLDLFMPHLNGLNAAAEILQQRRDAAILLLSMASEPNHVVAARNVGVRGYVVKTQAAEELIVAIQKVAAGGTYVSEIITRVMPKSHATGRDGAADPLTRRERQVLQLVVEGQKTKQIASLLGVTVKTAESYRAGLMTKLKTCDTAGLVRYAVRNGLIQPVLALATLPGT